MMMDSPTAANALQELLASVRDGRVSIEDAGAQLQARNVVMNAASNAAAVEDLGFASVDHARADRQGFPEVIFGAGKTPEQIARIALALHGRGSVVLATRCSPEAARATQQVLAGAQYDEMARTIFVANQNSPRLPGEVAVVCAGTSDLPVAREAVVSLRAMGAQVREVNDVGVAGVHRLLARMGELSACDVLIVVAGMEGALPSVVGGLVSVPVIAVPTSVGYGAAFGGLAALLGMLNTCASGVAVVNIDNGFGAAAFAASILRGKDVKKSTTDGHR
jgi:NCAIR mutase (PurE)-related protein